MAEETELYDEALNHYRKIVEGAHPARVNAWPVLTGNNVLIASLPGDHLAFIYKHTGNSGFRTTSGVGELTEDIIQTKIVDDASIRKAIYSLERHFDLRDRDAILITLKGNGGYLIPEFEFADLLHKHERVLGLCPMKLFLSHKSTDKSRVRAFKDTLELLGFDCWLDDDAMPAGAQPDRAISEGFEQSCAAVFFITPDFHDERWLATEIEYAMREKRTKGNLFSIITLNLKSADKLGDVPQLLTNYIYKTPSSELEALREIIRGLPIVVGPVRPR